MSDEPDWKAIAIELGQRVQFALKYCETRGSGQMITHDHQVRDWVGWFIEGLEKLPGVTVDREMLRAMRIPNARDREREIKLLKQRRANERPPAING